MKKQIILATILSLSLFGCSQKNAEKSNEQAAQIIEMNTPDSVDVLNLNLENSTLNWQGTKITGFNHKGTVKIAKGALYTQEDEPVGGEFILDMTQMTNKDDDGSTSEVLLKHLQSDDFFDVTTYPSAKIEITKLTPNIKRDFEVEADLTIKGKTNPVKFTAEINMDEKTANAEFAIDRTLWDVRYGSGKFFKGLGDNLIKDEMNFKIDLSFQ